jgi:hypothetical protein
MFKLLSVVAVIIALAGCASTSPTATKHGLIATASFDPLFLASAPGGPKKVDYKSAALMYRTSVPIIAELKDTFVVADTGVYLIEWDIDRATFSQKLFVPYKAIGTVQPEVVERSILPNSEVLKIVTTSNDIYYFSLFRGSAQHAKTVIEGRRNN